jgi:hypothetical protein
MIKITQGRSHKTLRQSDTDFTFSPDGIRLVPRASFEISENCPAQYQKFLYECWANGWIKPVAHMKDSEYTWELLQK